MKRIRAQYSTVGILLLLIAGIGRSIDGARDAPHS